MPIKLGIIGGGVMGEALLSRLLAQQLYQPDEVLVSELLEQRRDGLAQEYGIRVTANNQALFFHDLESLKDIVANIDHYPLRAVARDMKTFADRKYTWSTVSSRYANLAEGIERVEIPTFDTNSVATELAEKALQTPALKLPKETKLSSKRAAKKAESNSQFVRA